MYEIVVINESTVCQDAEVQAMVKAIQVQVSRDYSPIYGMNANVNFLPKGSKAPAGQWVIAVLDDSTQADALGFHDLTRDGLPLGKVFAAADKQAGDSVSVTLSHEIVECMADPWINFTAQMNDGKFWAVEIGDAVEADALGYSIGGVQVSDFVLPSYFQPSIKTTKFDFMGHLKGCCPALMPEGYASVFDPITGKWSQITAEFATVKTRLKARPPVGSRRFRRTVPLGERILSTV
ncbi:MAG: hypothetical protein JWP25_8971 [Bradyrhizobium sp.]|nr:hypothetical protein [Bradyrhizobium sp.]